MLRSRENDNSEQVYKKRRMLDTKTLYVIVAALVGPAGVTGLINAYTDPNVKQQARIETLETRNSSQDLGINGNKSEIAKQKMRVENYIVGHDEQVKLRQQITDKEFEHIRQLLIEIKDDVKQIKNGN